MSVGSPATTDVPGVFDVVIGQVGGALSGYMLARQVDPNLPFRTQRGRYGYSPTFLPRQNVSGDYGDNQQDFWLTVSMRDWSLGEGQKFFRTQDQEKSRQYWLGSKVNVSVPGQVTISRDVLAKTFAANCSGSIAYPAGSVAFTTSSTNLYEVNAAGTVTDRGAHGVGSTPTAFATDGSFLYLSYGAGAKVRKYDLSGHTFADFSAQPADSLVYLNNTLYGTKNNVLYTYDTAGSVTSSFTYKTATGAALPGTMKTLAFGGKVILMRNSGTTNGAELWEYDGVGVAKLAEYPGNFVAYDVEVQSGIIFLIGVEGKGGDGKRVALWYYANGTIGRAYATASFTSTAANFQPGLAAFGNGLILFDPFLGTFLYYDLQTGGVSTIGTTTATSGGVTSISTCDTFALATFAGQTKGSIIFDNTTVASSATLYTSLVDFESSLTKLFRGVIVDFLPASDGDGGSVDIHYQVDDVVTGSYTLLRTAAVSGTEYTFASAVTGRGVSVKIVLNKGTSTLGPTVKRVYVRAAPKLTKYRTGEYIFDCTGAEGKTPVVLRNNMKHPLSGADQVSGLIADATSGSLLTIADRIGSYTGVVELDTLDIIEVSPAEYYVRFTAREV